MFTYAVGDIHGSYSQLVNLFDHCMKHCGDDEPRFVFVGDYVDRGPHSREVVKLLMGVQEGMEDSIVCLRGNHESMLIAASKRRNETSWLANGGEATLLSYGVPSADEIPAEHLTWFKNLPLAISDGWRFYVHAGIEPGVPLQEQSEEIMLWIREPFLSDTRNHGQLIVHGHTPLLTGRAEVLHNRVNIDTGAVFGGPLTAAVFDQDNVGPIALITDDGTIQPYPPI
jgi:serine/threonine protein phosphatase 1